MRLAAAGTESAARQLLGLFHAAGRLEDSDRITGTERAKLRRTLRWFNHNLPVPKSLPVEAICWFRSDAHECILRVWNVARMLRAHGTDVRLITVEDPGRVVYRDSFQIAAVAYRELHECEHVEPRSFSDLIALQGGHAREGDTLH